jgi:hypothetical protein
MFYWKCIVDHDRLKVFVCLRFIFYLVMLSVAQTV